MTEAIAWLAVAALVLWIVFLAALIVGIWRFYRGGDLIVSLYDPAEEARHAQEAESRLIRDMQHRHNDEAMKQPANHMTGPED